MTKYEEVKTKDLLGNYIAFLLTLSMYPQSRSVSFHCFPLPLSLFPLHFAWNPPPVCDLANNLPTILV